MFVDKAKVIVRAGNGGNGAVSFRHEKFVDKGGPDGGDGGDGGNVVFVASRNENTLAEFRHNKNVKADSGMPGSKRRKHGKRGVDLIVKVPIGTVVLDQEGSQLADLVTDGQKEIIATGGKGGFGNAHFISSTRQAPNFAEKGEKTEKLELALELKLIADVGLVGFPNAGKSTLLSVLSNARPEIADYPFTTLTPNLGVYDVDKKHSLLMADIPGLIEGASKGKGLGTEFLRHIERTLVLVHLIDVYTEEIGKAYKAIIGELKNYKVDLSKLPELVVINKIDGFDKSLLQEKIKTLKKVVPKKTEIVAISALSKEGIKEFTTKIMSIVEAEKTRIEKAEKKELAGIPVIKLKDMSSRWEVKKVASGFEVSGKKIERFASRTDFDNNQSVNRLKDIMKKMGIMHELLRRGLKVGDNIIIGNKGSFTY